MKNTTPLSNCLLIAVLFLISMTTKSCGPKNAAVELPSSNSAFVSIRGQGFLDSLGRELTLHGINVVNKDPKTGYLGHITKEEFAMFKTWGFNVVRLGIIWDGLEPEPGVYNEEYLKGIDQMIRWATENGLYVFLDMHQDLYSVEFSDGAPTWATITENKSHETGVIWSDSYLISPAVQTAFDNFWSNAPASDGIGIQDHYLNLWQYLADRYANNTAVIGFDIMNEPFMGSGANEVMPRLLGAYAKMLVEQTGQAPPSEEELMYMWSAQRPEVLKTLAEKETYRTLIDAIYEVNAKFERETLTPFFQRCRDSIREVNKHHIVFLEHSYFTNMGVTGALGQIVDDKGQKDSLIAYAAHGYDLVVDTDALTLGSSDRVELIFERIAETGKRLNVPVIIGEWGALHGKSKELIKTADDLMNEFNKYKFGDTFWAYGQFLHEASFLKVLQKPYPVSIAGELDFYTFDIATGVFECKWQKSSDISAPSIFYLPSLTAESQHSVHLDGVLIQNSELDFAGADTGYISIPKSTGTQQRTLKVVFQK